MTKQEINERYFGDSILSKIKLNEEDSIRARGILLAKADTKAIDAMIENSRAFFKNFKTHD